jgi:hypothetical protein
LTGALFLFREFGSGFILGMGWVPEGSQREHHEDALGCHLQVQFPFWSAHLQQVQGLQLQSEPQVQQGQQVWVFSFMCS